MGSKFTLPPWLRYACRLCNDTRRITFEDGSYVECCDCRNRRDNQNIVWFKIWQEEMRNDIHGHT